MEILKCTKLKKQIKSKILVDDISFSINKGDVVGFIGPNGAGKSTIIKLILGLMKLSSGNVEINGYDIEKNFVKAIEKVGAIVENPDLYMYLSGYDNLKITANYYKNISQNRIEDVIKIIGLEKQIKDKVSTYSLGMKQRLAIGEAIINQPELLILDEPTNGLDIEGIIEMRNLIKKLSQQGMAILISSHNLTEIDNLCNRIIAIKDGKIVTNDTIENFKKDVKNNVSYELKLNSLDKIEKFIFDYKFELLKDNIIKVYISKENISNLIKKLIENGYQIYYTYVRNRFVLFRTAKNCYTQKLLSDDPKNPQPKMTMLTLKRVKEIFPHMEDIEYKVGILDEFNS